MKERKYYEQLISDSLDGPLEAEQRTELANAIDEDASLRLFRDALVKQSRTMENLPIQTTGHFELRGMDRQERGWLRRLWSLRISVPVPVAVVFVIAVVTGLTVLSPAPVTDLGIESKKIEEAQYVRTIQLEPAAAMVVDTKSTENSKNRRKS